MFPNIEAVAQTLKIQPHEVLDAANRSSVIKLMVKDAEDCFNAANIKHYERPAQFDLLPELMTVDNGLLTPKVSSCCARTLIAYTPQTILRTFISAWSV